MSEAIPLPTCIYFGGCSYGSCFYIGVYKRFIELWGEDFYQHTMISGGSAGTVICVAIALGKSPQYIQDNLYLRIANKAQETSGIYFGSVYLEEAVRDMIEEDPLSYKKIEGRCCFGTTAFFSQHRWHVSWESNEDLIQCILCSFHIPFYCKAVKPIHGELVLDGAYGLAGVDLIHDDETLFVGIDPHAEITRKLTAMQMFLPITGQECLDVIQSGYEKACEWDGFRYKKVGYRQPNYPALVILWTMMFAEYAIFRFFEIIYNVIISILRLFKQEKRCHE